MASARQPRPRRHHAQRTQVLVMLSGLAVVWLATGVVMWRSTLPRAMPERYLFQLRQQVKSTNPEADAAARWDGGDHRLLVLERGNGQLIPGVNAPDARAKYGVRVIPYLFDATSSKD